MIKYYDKIIMKSTQLKMLFIRLAQKGERVKTCIKKVLFSQQETIDITLKDCQV